MSKQDINRPDHATSPAELRAELRADTWTAEDTIGGGVWWPSDEAHAEILASDDPEARTCEIAFREPMRGTWHA